MPAWVTASTLAAMRSTCLDLPALIFFAFVDKLYLPLDRLCYLSVTLSLEIVIGHVLCSCWKVFILLTQHFPVVASRIAYELAVLEGAGPSIMMLLSGVALAYR